MAFNVRNRRWSLRFTFPSMLTRKMGSYWLTLLCLSSHFEIIFTPQLLRESSWQFWNIKLSSLISCTLMSVVVRMEIWLVIPKTFCLLKPLRNYILIICSRFFSLFIASSSINTHIQVMTFVERNNTSFMNMEDIEEIIFYKCRIVQFWSCLCWVEKRITSSLLKRLRINMKLHWSSFFFFSFSITPPHFFFIPPFLYFNFIFFSSISFSFLF